MRMDLATRTRLAELAEAYDVSQATVVRLAVKKMWEVEQGAPGLVKVKPPSKKRAR